MILNLILQHHFSQTLRPSVPLALVTLSPSFTSLARFFSLAFTHALCFLPFCSSFLSLSLARVSPVIVCVCVCVLPLQRGMPIMDTLHGWVNGGAGIVMSRALALLLDTGQCINYYRSNWKYHQNAADVVIACCVADYWQVGGSVPFCAYSHTHAHKPNLLSQPRVSRSGTRTDPALLFLSRHCFPDSTLRLSYTHARTPTG